MKKFSNANCVCIVLHCLSWHCVFYGVELWSGVLEWWYWSGVESDFGVVVLLPGIAEHSMIGKTDCSFDPGHV